MTFYDIVVIIILNIETFFWGCIMSRSYKHFTVCKDKDESKYSKIRANRKVRRSSLLFAGKSNRYRRLFESWDICDYRFVKTKVDTISEYEQDIKAYVNGQRTGKVSYLWKKRNNTLRKRLNNWEKYYYRK